MKKIKLLFQGDSITYAGRNFDDYHDLGGGYPKFAAQYIAAKYPDVEFEFINLGIGGNQTKDLVARLQTDFIDIQPDIVSIHIGINDVWHYSGNIPELGTEKNWLDNDIFEERYRTVLSAIKEKTNAKIMMMEPFLIPVENKQYFREDLYQKIEIKCKLAREYADVYLPTDGHISSAIVGDNYFTYALDGVHPTDKGADFIGKLYCAYISPLIDDLIK